MKFALNTGFFRIARVCPALPRWLRTSHQGDRQAPRLAAYGAAERVPAPGAYALLSGFVPR